ncbi:MAG: DUF2867 domain-containing protein [Burkholderiales bacterium]|nr:DUF2867 domain-containing protein [Burkholderiales bacterium]
MRAVPCDVPVDTRAEQFSKGAYFFDCFRIEVDDSTQTSLGLLLLALARAPRWTDVLMRLRNRLVQLVGLKNVGALRSVAVGKPESAYRPGDRVGVFTLRSNEPDEVVVGDDDKHLEVLVSLARVPQANGRQYVCLTTAVHLHNTLGRLYMIPVGPLHKLIAPAVLSQLAGLPV